MHRVDIVVPGDHPSTDGHFPGNPIVPGALLLSEVMGAWEGLLGGPLQSSNVKVAKFLSPTRPGDCVSIQFERLGVDDVKDTTVLSGRFIYA